MAEAEAAAAEAESRGREAAEVKDWETTTVVVVFWATRAVVVGMKMAVTFSFEAGGSR